MYALFTSLGRCINQSQQAYTPVVEGVHTSFTRCTHQSQKVYLHTSRRRCTHQFYQVYTPVLEGVHISLRRCNNVHTSFRRCRQLGTPYTPVSKGVTLEVNDGRIPGGRGPVQNLMILKLSFGLVQLWWNVVIVLPAKMYNQALKPT